MYNEYRDSEIQNYLEPNFPFQTSKKEKRRILLSVEERAAMGINELEVESNPDIVDSDTKYN